MALAGTCTLNQHPCQRANDAADVPNRPDAGRMGTTRCVLPSPGAASGRAHGPTPPVRDGEPEPVAGAFRVLDRGTETAGDAGEPRTDEEVQEIVAPVRVVPSASRAAYRARTALPTSPPADDGRSLRRGRWQDERVPFYSRPRW